MSGLVWLLRRQGHATAEAWASEAVEKLRARVTQDVRIGTVRLFALDVEQAPLVEATGGTATASFDAALLLELADAERTALEATGLGALLDPLARSAAYRVRSRTLKTHRAAPAGDRTPGLALVSPVRRSAAVTHAEFDEHWRERHGPIALRHHVGMWGYEQHVVDEVLTRGATPFDGIALLHFATAADFAERLYDSPAGRRTVGTDIERFLALERSEAALMGEYVVKPSHDPFPR